MEASCYYSPTKAHNFCSSLFSPKPNFSSIPSQPIHPQQLSFSRHDSGRGLSNRGSLAAAIGCCAKGGGGPATGAERELEEEMKSISGELDGIEGGWREKCEEGGGGGIAELMECLEREAIAGEDEGREANDYNRRAIIFDKSSRVFQALKEKDAQKS
ncbi:hypothetical protein RHGRI_008180 [Rhododendron griersonianum]|uniref:Uncharacterized protein n=1 Tax=Rhododendron griersonianum TaxID=479676 RepID=A0AAV6L0V6_9ERIC|nr:hypothetical protein RHGRI_008180 [Rhododendron griersonianum]